MVLKDPATLTPSQGTATKSVHNAKGEKQKLLTAPESEWQ
jgi:hypothetical protein